MSPVQDFHFIFDPDRWVYRLIDQISFYSPRFKKWINLPAGMESDGASGPATDIVSLGWWVHDRLVETGQWDDGTPCSILDSSLVLRDILWSEGRRIRACSWFVATFVFGYLRKAVLMKICMMIMVGLLVGVFGQGCTAMHVMERDRRIIRAQDIIEIKTGWEDGWEAKVGVDVLRVSRLRTGLWAAITEDTGPTLGKIAVDAVLAGGALYLYKQSKDESSEPEKPQPTYNIQAGNVIIGEGNSQTWNGGE